MTYGELHDATLTSLQLQWASGNVEVLLKTGVAESDVTTLIAHDITALRCPRLQPWGPSTSVNCVDVEQLSDGSRRLAIEMQTGDLIEVDCIEVSIERPGECRR